MTDPNRLTAAEAARLIVRGELTSTALVASCLARIRERDPEIRAWAAIDEERAMAQAAAADRGEASGPLRGVPFGVKDIIDTADLPTECNSPIYAGHRPAADADCVARLMAAGAILLGKTATSEFAYLSPAQTGNPHNPLYTPGGSSSGSAAATADFMVPVALGTQTGGSTIRPASYCGVFAFKPSYAAVSIQGIKALAPSLDTIGWFGRSVEDLALLYGVLADGEAYSPGLPHRLRIGLCHTPFWDMAGPATRDAIGRVSQLLAEQGMLIGEIALPPDIVALNAGFYPLVALEAAPALRLEYDAKRELLSPQIRALLESGRAPDLAQVQKVKAAQLASAVAVDRLFDCCDALLTPAAPDEPVRGRALGDNEFNRIWTAMHLPCVTIPAGVGPQKLPVGIQLVGRRGTDRSLLDAAAHLAEIIATVA